MIIKNGGGFYGQRTVHINFAVTNQAFVLQRGQFQQQILAAVHRKGGDNHIAAALKGVIDGGGEKFLLGLKINGLIMVQAVAVGGFHYQIISGLHLGGVIDNGGVIAAQITGEQHLLRLAVFGVFQHNHS